MSQDQLTGLLRQLLPYIAGWATAKGWFPDVATATSLLTTTLQIIGPLGIVIGGWWSLVANSRKSILKSVDQMTDVKAVISSNQDDVRDKNLPKVVAKASDAP